MEKMKFEDALRSGRRFLVVNCQDGDGFYHFDDPCVLPEAEDFLLLVDEGHTPMYYIGVWEGKAKYAFSFVTKQLRNVRSSGELRPCWEEFPSEKDESALARFTEERQCIDQAPRLVVEKVEIKGHGYDGGHNTAARLGWSVSFPEVPDDFLLWWDSTTEGRHTGFHPAITGVRPVRSP
jgi:hypothetical protein